MDTTIPAFLRHAARLFLERGAPLCLVGGWPRNRLLGLPPGDLDVGSELTAEEASALFRMVPDVRLAERNTRLGTFGVLCRGDEAEYTAFRTESYGAGGAHKPESVRFGVTMKQDALRRDFTANAIYHDIAAGVDEDPLGGLADIRARVLRTCRKPEDTFADDGLRLMRLARFSCELGFDIEKETWQAARLHAPLLHDIAPERVQAELNRILLADTKYPDVPRGASPVLTGLHLLDGLGLLALIAPEFEACRGVEQRADYHDHDVLEHLLRTAACAPADITLRLAALLHDIGKPEALRQGGRMLGHDRLGEGMARAVLKRLRYSNALTAEVAELIRRHMYDLDGRTGEPRLRLFFARLGRERSRKLVSLRRADVCGSKDEPAKENPTARWEAVLERMNAEGAPWTERELDVGGDDLAALCGGPGETVGRLKAALHRHAVLHPQDNRHDRLMKLAAAMLKDPKGLERSAGR